MSIACNELQQTINSLLIAFKDCNKIKNSDLRKLVDLSVSLYACSNGGGGETGDIQHNATENIQGGSLFERFHLTQEQYNNLEFLINKVDSLDDEGYTEGDDFISFYTTVKAVNDGLSLKVDKVTGKSLVLDTEITRLGTLANYTHPANHPPSIITQDTSNRFVTDAEKATWNAKQANLGYTAENVANKSDSYTTSSSTTYASTKAVVDGLATKISGTGTTNYLPKFTSAGVLGNSQIFDNGSRVWIGGTDNGVDKLQVDGSALIQGQRISSDYHSNLFIGTGAGENNTPLSITEGAQNTFIGYQAGNKNTTGYAKTNLGYNSGYNETTGNGNCNIGYQSGFSNILGNFNTNLGTDAGARNRGNNNTFLGWHAGFGFSTFLTGDNNHLVGYESGINMLTAYSNNGHGSRVFYNLTDGFNNTAMGDLAGFSLTTGYNNSLFGRDAGYYLVSGNNNSIFGQRTGYYLTGELNTLIGGSAGFLLTNADLNVFLGGNSGTNVLQKVDAYNSIAIGFNTYTTKNFQAVIGNIDIGETILRGAVLINTETNNGVDKLQVNGNISATSYTGSATLTGTPTAPTATAGTNTTQIATTAFVQNAMTSGTYVPTFTNTTNISSSTLNAAYYTKINNIITVTIAVQLTLTATADTVFTFSLPVSGATVVNGVGQGNLTSGGGSVNAYGIVDTTNSTTAQLRIGSAAVAGSGAGVANIIFTYSL